MDPEYTKDDNLNQACADSISTSDSISKRQEQKEIEYPENKVGNDLYYDLSGKISVTVFVHETYKKRYPQRVGIIHDIIRLKKLFKTVLTTEFKIINDATKQEIVDELKKVSNLDSKEYSCLIIVVMTHGTVDKLAALDGDYERSVLWENLAGKFVGKPKLCFIQACRGDSLNEGVEVADSIYQKPEEEGNSSDFPNVPDFLQMHSTIEGDISWMENEGSWFIKSLCEVIEEKHKELDLETMLILVNKKVANKDFKYDSKIVKEMSQVVSTLSKFLKFNDKESYVKNDSSK